MVTRPLFRTGLLVFAAAFSLRSAATHAQTPALTATAEASAAAQDGAAKDSAAARDTDRPVQIDEATMLSHALTKAAPLYPPEAKEQHLAGAVVIYAIINENGTVRSLSVVSGPNIFRMAALNALNQWTFEPYQLNGRPAKVGTLFTVSFTPPAN